LLRMAATCANARRGVANIALLLRGVAGDDEEEEAEEEDV